ncbi:hypothetical protein [Flavobacterium suncheonense]|uniref:Uncharacterized protein n=1 Tax=Flavobacterium suncheonense GH29-5 = DSM 17707 TaxID=1121899 RepID=A0A0A2MBC0_9FLAO|nr:hypothetical protein [Flavobacterium suncheonense]KGO89559.1 hypothetical protein Q764_07250 [Flavobacterium suncheonense GH29-5 = DSM 17707]
MLITNDKITFESTGREKFIMDGRNSFSINGDMICTGYDDVIFFNDGLDDTDNLKPEERKELAIFMIKQWADFAEIDIKI